MHQPSAAICRREAAVSSPADCRRGVAAICGSSLGLASRRLSCAKTRGGEEPRSQRAGGADGVRHERRTEEKNEDERMGVGRRAGLQRLGPGWWPALCFHGLPWLLAGLGGAGYWALGGAYRTKC